jgi:hypothetical protein
MNRVTSSFSKLFNKYVNHNVYDLRKAISSKAIDEGNKEYRNSGIHSGSSVKNNLKLL